MILKVERVLEGSNVELGRHIRLHHTEIVLGRDTQADVVLHDTRVSRRHARLFWQEGVLWLENLSRHETFHNGQQVEAAVRVNVRDWIQIGGVLMRIHEEQTEPVPRVMTIDVSQDRPPALTQDEPPPQQQQPTSSVLRLELQGELATFLGHTVQLRPLPFAALVVLASSAGAWIRTHTLIDTLWPDDSTITPLYVNKLISYVRAALRDAIDGDSEAVDELRQLIVDNADGYTDHARLSEMDTRALLRELIKARRKVGFRLCLGPSHVQVV